MSSFLKTRTGIVSAALFALLMAFMFHRVIGRRRTGRIPPPAAAGPGPHAPFRASADAGVPPDEARGNPFAETAALRENAAYLDQYYGMNGRIRRDQDPQGNPVTRRRNAGTPPDAGRVTVEPVPVEPAAVRPVLSIRRSLRLEGRTGAAPQTRQKPADAPRTAAPDPIGDHADHRRRPGRFNPYGSVIKCELVFTIDSTNEQTPLVGIVMEPAYNNGLLVIPAGAELHGVARPDRLRDRIFSGQEWVLVFPREGNRPNGRQLNVRGVALDRVEPNANGMTWGLTDGSYGIEGKVIRTLDAEEIKRFAATFLAEAAQTLEQRRTARDGIELVSSTPQNALLQGIAANLEQLAQDISAEITRHGVFIRVPAGHQFYFYPMQIIDPDLADLSADIAVAR